MFTFRTFVMTLLASLALGPATAQDPSTLILEEKPRVTVRPRGEQSAAPKPDVAPAPTPDPRDVLVGIVNLHVLTKADLESRVEGRYENIREEVLARAGGIVMTLDENMKQQDSILATDAEPDIQAEQEQQFRQALREEMGRELKTWVDHMMLADEARRQGIAVSEGDFRRRLEDAERQNRLDRRSVDMMLAELRITREDYERSVYDALLIERLLDRFIDENYTEEMLRDAYDRGPHFYREPQRHYLAHFCVVLDGSEDRRSQAKLKTKAEEVAALLRSGTDPEELFNREQYDQMDLGFWGAGPAWFTLATGALRPAVAAEVAKMKPGETSKVITQLVRRGTETVPLSYHVVKVFEIAPATGDTFESAIPTIRTNLVEIARETLLSRLYEAGTHRVFTNLRGIPPGKIPSRDELLLHGARVKPVDLRIPRT